MNIFRDFFEQHWRPFGQLGPRDIPQDILNDFYGNQEHDKHSHNWDFDVSSDIADNFVSEFEEAFEGFFKTFIPYAPFHAFGGNEVLTPGDDYDEPNDNAKSLQERMLKNDTAENPRGHSTPMFPFGMMDDWRTIEGDKQFTNPREDKDVGNEVLTPDDDYDEPNENAKSLQERMLENETAENPRHHSTPMFPFGMMDDWRALDRDRNFTNPSSGTREDKDLDEDFRNGEKSIDDVLPASGKPLLNSPRQSPRSSYFFSSSSSVTRNQDGVIESKKTITDSSGNKEVTITRKDADGKEHTVSYKTDRYGNEQISNDGTGCADRGQKGLLQSLPDTKDSYQPRLSFYDRIRHWFNEKNDQ